MNDLIVGQQSERMSESLHVLLLQLLTFAIKRINKNYSRSIIDSDDDESVIGLFIESDEAVVDRLNSTMSVITRLFETHTQKEVKNHSLHSVDKTLPSYVQELQQKLINSMAINEEASLIKTKDVTRLIRRNHILQDRMDNLMSQNYELTKSFNECMYNFLNVTNMIEKISNINYQNSEIIESCRKDKDSIRKELSNVAKRLDKMQGELQDANTEVTKNKGVLEKTIPEIIKAKVKNGFLTDEFYIVNKKSGLAITVDSTNITTSKPRRLSGQIWEYKKRMLYNKLNSKVLTIDNGYKLTLSEPSATSNQIWDFNEDGTIVSQSQHALDLSGGDYVAGSEVIAYSVPHGGPNQVFNIRFVQTDNMNC